MAIDTRQKRMSALAPAAPWRGPLVDASEVGFLQNNRQAAAFLYSGVAAGLPAEEGETYDDLVGLGLEGTLGVGSEPTLGWSW